jgi:hypothetical protein
MFHFLSEVASIVVALGLYDLICWRIKTPIYMD